MTGLAIGASFAAGIAFGTAVVPIIFFLCATLFFTEKVRLLWCGVVCAAALAGVVRAVPAPSSESPAWVDEANALRGRVHSGPMTTTYGQRFELRVFEVRVRNDWGPADTVVCVSAAEPPVLQRGDRVFLIATGEQLEDLPMGIGIALAARGCTASFTAWRTSLVEEGSGWRHTLDGVRRRVAGQLQTDTPGDAGALMAGLVTGDDGAMSDDVREAFVATGTTHITAISGGNLALVVVSLTAFSGWSGLGRRVYWLVMTALGVWVYALLVGLEAPVLRAALVATGVVFAASFGRRADLVTLTAVASTLQLMYRPEDYWSLSFRLSFASALALTLAVRGSEVNSFRGVMRSALIAVTAAQIAATPVLISSFGAISPLSLPANVAIAPFVALAFPTAAIAGIAGLLSNDLAAALSAPGALFALAIINIVKGLDAVQGTQMAVATDGGIRAFTFPLISIAIVALLSVECRQAVRRSWRAIRCFSRTEYSFAATGAAAFAVGLAVEALR